MLHVSLVRAEALGAVAPLLLRVVRVQHLTLAVLAHLAVQQCAVLAVSAGVTRPGGSVRRVCEERGHIMVTGYVLERLESRNNVQVSQDIHP